MRIGIGYDVHRLVEDRKLILGGVEIPHSLGLLGHSDADVLIHAIMDALLGAVALGDIGKAFPDTSAEFKDISSVLLLERVMRMLDEVGYEVINVDSVIVAQQPKLAPFIPEMRAVLAATMRVELSQVNVKATTTEKLNFEGRELGISSQAVALLKKK
ncbi:MAG: 2-C-methyl-D-erythritol 2,4-cyclodiphosphate synthase [Clostridia bacterium]|nr:2-C-methyl-D-erythritol 2,4-cyclodiphosphate synthase [Clostridia bacterium]